MVNSPIAQDSREFFLAFFLIKKYILLPIELFTLRRSTALVNLMQSFPGKVLSSPITMKTQC